jgi:heme/copper-type cytochrome/quinol oxidase subunit 1
MTPSKLANNGVFSILELLSDLYWVVAAFAVILGILLICSIFGGVFDGGG